MSKVLGEFSSSMRSLGAVFANADLARLVIAWGGMTFMTWAFAIALGVYAFEQGGATAVGIAALVRLLPGALASPFAGLLGDRHSRSVVLTLSAGVSAAAIGLAAVAVANGAPDWVVYAFAGVFTVASTPYVPAEGALLPKAARTPLELSASNVVHSQLDNVGFLAAAITTGVLLAVATPQVGFLVAALAGIVTALLLATLSRDRRPEYADDDAAGVLREIGAGFRAMTAEPRTRLVGILLTALVFVEGTIDVMMVVVALDLLGLGEGSVGWMNAAWGVGALIAGTALAMLLDRGNLAAGLAVGCLIVGAGLVLPGAWPAVAAAYVGFFAVGFGYTFVEVAAKTLLQRLGSDETLARALAFLESSRLLAMAAGSMAAPAAIALLGVRGALLAMGALLPLLAVLRWGALRRFEIGAPVNDAHYGLLRSTPILAPLPVDRLEGLTRVVVEVEALPGQDVVTEGDHGDRFYVIEEGCVEVFEEGKFKRNQGVGECFGEIALIRDVPRTATVRATEPTRLLALDREHFLETVTGHARSHEQAHAVADGWYPRRETKRV
jgi:MFS family permease